MSARLRGTARRALAPTQSIGQFAELPCERGPHHVVTFDMCEAKLLKVGAIAFISASVERRSDINQALFGKRIYLIVSCQPGESLCAC